MDEDGQMAELPKHVYMRQHQYFLTWKSSQTKLSAYPGEGSSLLLTSGEPIRTPGLPTFFDAGF
ncbi:MAG: hypothetical protein NPIRA03_08840 [Nitrospirales bacterium]|nr:MAG: hypothetical protein NPIRA03_08840 [Nitrospirales bacterium]